MCWVAVSVNVTLAAQICVTNEQDEKKNAFKSVDWLWRGRRVRVSNDRLCIASHRHLQTLHYHRYYTRVAMDLVFIMPIYEIFLFSCVRFHENSHMNINSGKMFSLFMHIHFCASFWAVYLFFALALALSLSLSSCFAMQNSHIWLRACSPECVNACGLLYVRVTVTLGGARLCWCWL